MGPLLGERGRESLRHVLETVGPQEGEEQDQNILQGAGGGPGQRGERSSGPPPGPVHPTAPADRAPRGQAFLTGQSHHGQVTSPSLGPLIWKAWPPQHLN